MFETDTCDVEICNPARTVMIICDSCSRASVSIFIYKAKVKVSYLLSPLPVRIWRVNSRVTKFSNWEAIMNAVPECLHCGGHLVSSRL